MSFQNNSIFYRILLSLMFLGTAAVGFVKGTAEEGGKDAQWYSATLLSDNIDFYNHYLLNFNDWFMRSVPNYYFQLYYLLYPASYLSWDTFKMVWLGANFIMLVILLELIRRDFKLDFKKMALLFLPFFLGFPLLSVYTNGQSTILILLFIYLSWRYRNHKILLPVFLSLLMIKYSFGIPIIFGFLLMGYYRSIILSALLTLVFPLLYSIQFNLSFISSIFLPLKVATSPTANSLGSGPGDVMSLFGLYSDQPLMSVNVLTIGLAVFVGLYALISVKYQLDQKTIFISSLFFSLFGFFHFGQAYLIFLLLLPFYFNSKQFYFIYVYLLLFCCVPRFIRVLNFLPIDSVDVKEFMRNKYFVILNVVVLLGFFVQVITANLKHETTLKLKRSSKKMGIFYPFS